MVFKFVRVFQRLKLCSRDAWVLSPLALDDWRAELMACKAPPLRWKNQR